MRARRGAALLAFAALAAGCGDSSYRGSWEVVGYKRPALSVMGNPEAEIWLGVPYDLTAKTAAVAGDTCDVAEARRQTLSVFDLEMSYNLTKGELGIAEPSAEMLEVQCSAGEIPWGRELIRLGPDSLLAPYNGIFLVLGKRPGKGS